MALGELEGVLTQREKDFRDQAVRMDDLGFDPADGRLTIGGERFRLQGQALDQIAARLRVPANYLRRCPPELLAENLNYWKEQTDGDVLVRFDRGEVRALLSERYRPVSNLELVRSLLSTCPAESPVRWEMDATRLALQVLRPAPERTLLGGVSAQNSETGHCIVELNALVYRVVCTNGLILSGGEVTVRRRHTRESGATIEELRRTISDAWPKAVRHADRFDAMRMVRATPAEPVFERIDREYGIKENQTAAVRAAYRVEPGHTLFDVINAYTRAGNCPELSLDERTELQVVGGRVLASAERGRLWN
jgi:hypothetical protein